MGKRIYLNGLFGFAAAFAAGIAGVSAADMETKSGRYEAGFFDEKTF